MFHEFVTFDKRTGAICGHFRTTTPDLLPHPRSPETAHVAVTEETHREALRALTPSHRLVGSVSGDKIASLRLEPRFQGKLVLSCDAADLDQDGRPELAADGTSSTLVTARLVGVDGATLPDVSTIVRFVASRGALLTRTAESKYGSAVVELRSSVETVQSTVAAEADGFERGTLTLEFIPPPEYSELSKRRDDLRR